MRCNENIDAIKPMSKEKLIISLQIENSKHVEAIKPMRKEKVKIKIDVNSEMFAVG